LRKREKPRAAEKPPRAFINSKRNKRSAKLEKQSDGARKQNESDAEEK
jgi:hypothetical protein